ncbi:transglycosylase [Capnocytophaga canimorsus]|uniref:GlsB/YeaQ/YmgE family stress response membrane protein n=2 Tax=Capnocytophaga canimorsus TaxID=28188 RepID=A0AAC9Z129_9FLAO|nr:GlsB/YeaQ/YmgE family stress response membrane protein [Capnocytophaga canimorsus]GIM56930.1 transglycosylase [Capnocytophaga canimorsus]
MFAMRLKIIRAMNVVSWIIIGLIAAFLMRIIALKKEPGGFWVSTMIGLSGAIIGGFLGNMLQVLKYSDSFWSFKDWAFAFLGSFTLLVAWKIFLGWQHKT